MIATARSVSATRIIRSLTRVAHGVTTSDHLAELLGCTPEELIESLVELANAGKVRIWPAPQGGLGIILAGKRRVRPRPKAGKAATGLNLDREPARRSRSAGVDDRHCYGMPEPGMILLGHWTAWKGPRWAGKRPCPVCGGRQLSVDTYCLVCDRWGRDGGTWGRNKGPEPIRAKLPERNGLKGGKG